MDDIKEESNNTVFNDEIKEAELYEVGNKLFKVDCYVNCKDNQSSGIVTVRHIKKA